MAIEINGKTYRNLQEQVYENTKDIEELSRDVLRQYRHKITLSWEDDGEEPDYKKVYFEWFSSRRDEYTLETFKEDIVGHIHKIEFAKYEDGNNNIPNGAILTKSITIGVDSVNDLQVFSTIYRLYDSLDTEVSTNFTATYLEDNLE